MRSLSVIFSVFCLLSTHPPVDNHFHGFQSVILVCLFAKICKDISPIFYSRDSIIHYQILDSIIYNSRMLLFPHLAYILEITPHQFTDFGILVAHYIYVAQLIQLTSMIRLIIGISQGVQQILVMDSMRSLVLLKDNFKKS